VLRSDAARRSLNGVVCRAVVYEYCAYLVAVVGFEVLRSRQRISS
jgi:hypothetical protein